MSFARVFTSHSRRPIPCLKPIWLLLAVSCWLSAVSGQWLEKIIFLPDSLSGVPWPSCIALDSVDGKVYISGTERAGEPRVMDCYVVVADAETGNKLARIAVDGMTASLLCNPVAHKLYAAHPDADLVSVIDPVADTVVATIGIYAPSWLYCNATNGRVYCLAKHYGGALTVIDPARDSVVKTIALQGTHAAAAFLPRVNKVYCARGEPASVAVLDAHTDSLIRVVDLPAYVWDMVVSTTRDRAYFLLGSMELAIVDTRNDSLLQTIPTGAAYECGMLCYNPQRDELYFPGFGDTVLALGGACDSVVRKLYPGGRFYYYLACLPEQDLLFSADDGVEVQTIRAMDLASGRLIGTVEANRAAVATMVDAARRKVYYVNHKSGDVAVIPAPTGPLKAERIVVGAMPTKICFAEPVNKLYCADGNNSIVSVIDGETNRVVANVPAGYEMNDICYSATSNKVYVANGLDSSVTIIDCTADTVICELRVGEIPRALCYSPVQNRVYCASYLAEQLVVIDCESNTVVKRIYMGGPDGLFYNPARDEVFCREADAGETAILDCGSNRIVGTRPYLFSPEAVYCPPEEKVFYWSGEIKVMDALRDSLIDSLIGTPGSLWCYNPVAHKVYASDDWYNALLIVDAVTDSLIGGRTILGAWGTLYDAAHGRVYVASNAGAGQVWILDGASDSVVSVVDVRGQNPTWLAWNRSRGRVYCANWYSGSISVVRDTSPTAVAETARPAVRRQAAPTLIRASNVRLAPALALYDAVGRRLASPSRVPRRLAIRPGVYFIIGRDGSASKVVVVP
jgi:YVTN family beta-propeller protein